MVKGARKLGSWFMLSNLAGLMRNNRDHAIATVFKVHSALDCLYTAISK